MSVSLFLFRLWKNIILGGKKPFLIGLFDFFFCLKLYEFFIYFGYYSFVKYLTCKYFLPFSDLPFRFVKGFLCRLEV